MHILVDHWGAKSCPSTNIFVEFSFQINDKDLRCYQINQSQKNFVLGECIQLKINQHTLNSMVWLTFLFNQSSNESYGAISCAIVQQ